MFSLFGSVLGRVMCHVSWCCPKQHLTLQDSLQCDSVTQSRFLVVTPSILSVVTLILRHVTLVTPVTLTHRNIAQCHKCYNLTPDKAEEGPKWARSCCSVQLKISHNCILTPYLTQTALSNWTKFLLDIYTKYFLEQQHFSFWDFVFWSSAFSRQFCFRNDILSWLDDNNIDIHYKYNSQSHWWLQRRFSIKTTNGSHQPILDQHFVQKSQFLPSQHQPSSGAATSLKIRRKSSIILLLRILRVSCYFSCCNYAITLLTLGRCKMS